MKTVKKTKIKTLRKASKIIDVVVFVATTLAIAGVFYEGMTLKWYDIVGMFVICMDYSFMPATIIHLIVDRKEKMIWFLYGTINVKALWNQTLPFNGMGS